MSLNCIDTLDKKDVIKSTIIKRELQQDTENPLLIYIQKYIFPLNTFVSRLPTNNIINIFDIILCIYVHFQHCF